ncbi:hypothetical protein N7474_007541 [Penicillium riverlandense]|uniref:uncharacterized protein n=1 Tax=Penicillium riverlandense TaxID=1903569 RepID=UPI002548CCC3|nr:uncharacterized protein N7474_007541 [Penicillium riverlandense]KAJ5815764.1 hypothetical protein N7474_007541 [Penicillium riverlandense]
MSRHSYSFPIEFAGQYPHGLRRVINNPYPDYNSASWNSTWRGSHRACLGPHGRLLDRHDADTMMSGYHWNASDFPAPIFGSYESWGLDRDLCADSVSRYGAYGYKHRTDNGWPGSYGTNHAAELEWDDVNWANLQHDCLLRNGDRFRTTRPREKQIWTLHKRWDTTVHDELDLSDPEPGIQPRTAVIMRTWLSKRYMEDDLHYIRAMIMELALHSGGEYDVVVLVDCKGAELPNPMDTVAMDKFKAEHLPRELRELALFFNTKILKEWYPEIEAHDAVLQYFQPVQLFSRLHPQYEYVWQFEMDARYTGHFYRLVTQATDFARRQPRKHLWERNSYFYIPAIHGTWEEFAAKVDRDMVRRDSIWGPQPAEGIDLGGHSPVPPVASPDDDESAWGVGEEADLITWLPHFDPAGVNWPWGQKIYHFQQQKHTPRRATIVAMSRLSNRLLRVMHKDQAYKGLGLASEMTPISWAMYYGLKAVQVPQPVYHERAWDAAELDRRANSGEPGEINGDLNSIWGCDSCHDILLYTSFMFRSYFAERLYRAWLGYDGAEEWEKTNRPLCLPPIFIHPVKNTER